MRLWNWVLSARSGLRVRFCRGTLEERLGATMGPSDIFGVAFWNLNNITWSVVGDCFWSKKGNIFHRTIILGEHNLLHVHSSICSP